MSKKKLIEAEIPSQYIRPAIVEVGWKPPEIREENHFTTSYWQITNM